LDLLASLPFSEAQFCHDEVIQLLMFYQRRSCKFQNIMVQELEQRLDVSRQCDRTNFLFTSPCQFLGDFIALTFESSRNYSLKQSEEQ
jgi:hypothetical protein